MDFTFPCCIKVSVMVKPGKWGCHPTFDRLLSGWLPGGALREHSAHFLTRQAPYNKWLKTTGRIAIFLRLPAAETPHPSFRIDNSQMDLTETSSSSSPSTMSHPESFNGSGHVEHEGYPPVPLCVLCPKCLDIFHAQPDFTRENPNTNHYSSPPLSHHPTETALRDSASAGCVLCSLVLDQFTAMRIYDKDGERRASLADGVCYAVRLTYAQNVTIMFFATNVENWSQFGDPRTGRLKSPSTYFILDRIVSAVSPLRRELQIPQRENTTTGSSQCLHLAKHWLDECAKHETCRHPVPGMEARPQRLVQIWKSTDAASTTTTSTIKARLCCSVPDGTPYATLSHRWGPDPAVRLLETNLDHLSQEIPTAKLEQAFQDAIQVVWALGLTHLWVDTLCIQQDSPADWAAQSSEMGAIYKNAVCNIAAACSEDGTGGLFVDRDPFLHFSPHFSIHWGDFTPDDDTDTPTRLAGFYIFRDYAHFDRRVSDAPLNQRGWVAQERELSPCILVFERQQIFWKCGEVLACESFPRRIPGMETYNWNTDTRTLRNLIESEQTTIPDENTVVRFWNAFVNRYSATDLTRPRDRLPAAFGMARELLSLMPGNQLLAGLWSSHLTEGLLWRVDEYSDKGSSENAGPATILTDFQVPSWSWASLDRAVMCDPHKTHGEFQLLAEAVPDGFRRPLLGGNENGNCSNPFVVCNRIKLRSYRLSTLSKALELAKDLGDDKDPFRAYPDIVDKKKLIVSPFGISLADVVDDDNQRLEDGTVEQRKIRAATCVIPVLLIPHWDIAIGLLVNPSSSGEQRTFTRVGTFEAWFKDRESLRSVFPLPLGVKDESKVADWQSTDLETIFLI